MSADPDFLDEADELEDPLAAFDLFDDTDSTAAKQARFERIARARELAKSSYSACYQEPQVSCHSHL